MYPATMIFQIILYVCNIIILNCNILPHSANKGNLNSSVSNIVTAFNFLSGNHVINGHPYIVGQYMNREQRAVCSLKYRLIILNCKHFYLTLRHDAKLKVC